MQHRISIPLELQISISDDVSDFVKDIFCPQVLKLLMRVENDGRKSCPPGKPRTIRMKEQDKKSLGVKAVTEVRRIRIG